MEEHPKYFFISEEQPLPPPQKKTFTSQKKKWQLVNTDITQALSSAGQKLPRYLQIFTVF
jgi:hypothetical protein